jgi:NADP-dependent 3-hydroxy acid dehydrogenase YdfG
MAATQRVMLITGASSGIGEATARAAAQADYRLVLAARSEDRLAALATELGGPERALAAPCDVTEFDSLEAVVTRSLEHFGRIDAAFANAGFGAARGFGNESPARWRSMVLTNVLGVAYTIRATLEPLKQSHGHLVLTGAIAGLRPLPGSLYSATKAAVRAMSESVRQELRGSGVRVTLIEPGTVDTPFYDNPQADALAPADVAAVVMHALAQPLHVDVSQVVLRSVEQRDL